MAIAKTKVDDLIPPVDLRRAARAIVANGGEKGAIVISVGKKGVRVGCEGLSPEELRRALCTAIHYSFAEEMQD